MSRIKNIKKHSFSQNDRLLFDTNIWFHLFGAGATVNNKIQIYSDAFKRMLDVKSNIFINVLVLSEFINRYARQKCPDKLRSDFKKFRNKPEFKPIAQEIADVSRRILKCSQKVASGFEALDIDQILTAFSNQSCDFNDQMIDEYCVANGLVLVTEDADFKKAKCNILTANHNLLS